MTGEKRPEVEIQQFAFRPDEFMEITFVERRDQGGDKAGLIKTVVFDPSVVRKEDFDDVMDTLRDFVDAALRYIRTGEVGG